MIDIVYKRNCVYQAAYHVVWCTKYRKPILRNEVAKRADNLIDAICVENHWNRISHEIQPEHIHLFISFSPVISIFTAIKKLKGITAGNVSAKTIKKYRERVEHMKGRR